MLEKLFCIFIVSSPIPFLKGGVGISEKKKRLKGRNAKKYLMMMMMMMMMNCFCGMVDRRKAEPYFQPGPLSESLTIANLRHAASRI